VTLVVCTRPRLKAVINHSPLSVSDHSAIDVAPLDARQWLRQSLRPSAMLQRVAYMPMRCNTFGAAVVSQFEICFLVDSRPRRKQ
jgi:hypothetical protein